MNLPNLKDAKVRTKNQVNIKDVIYDIVPEAKENTISDINLIFNAIAAERKNTSDTERTKFFYSVPDKIKQSPCSRQDFFLI